MIDIHLKEGIEEEKKTAKKIWPRHRKEPEVCSVRSPRGRTVELSGSIPGAGEFFVAWMHELWRLSVLFFNNKGNVVTT